MTIALELKPALTREDTKIEVHGVDESSATWDTLAAWGLDYETCFHIIDRWWGSLGWIGFQADAGGWEPGGPHGGTRTLSLFRDTHPLAVEGKQPDPIVRSVPIRARIDRISQEPSIISRQVYDNGLDDPETFEGSVAEHVTQSVESNWSEDRSIGVSQAVSVEVGVGAIGGNVSAETTLSYNTSWGKGGSRSEDTEVGDDIKVAVDLKPHQMCLAALTAYRGDLTASVDVVASLLGDGVIVCKAKNRHYWTSEGVPGHYVSFAIRVSDVWRMRDSYPGATVAPPVTIPSVTNTLELTCGFFADAEARLLPLSSDDPSVIEATATQGMSPAVTWDGDKDDDVDLLAVPEPVGATAAAVAAATPDQVRDVLAGVLSALADADGVAREHDLVDAFTPSLGAAARGVGDAIALVEGHDPAPAEVGATGSAPAGAFYVVREHGERITAAETVLSEMTAGGHVRGVLIFRDAEKAGAVVDALNEHDEGWTIGGVPWKRQPSIGPAVFGGSGHYSGVASAAEALVPDLDIPGLDGEASA